MTANRIDTLIPPRALGIGEYGLLADGHTAALVGSDGNVGWLCAPRFDSPALLAGILDPHRGGTFRVSPVFDSGGPPRGVQRYSGDTNVLVTHFSRPGQRARVTDWMPAQGLDDAAGGPATGSAESGIRRGSLCRLVEVLAGPMELRVRCEPRFQYGRRRAQWQRSGPRVWHTPGDPELSLASSHRLVPAAEHAEGETGLEARLRLGTGESAWFVLAWGGPAEGDLERLRASLAATLAGWRRWARRGQYAGPYRQAVMRSALALKALIYTPTGAMVAAPTTSLPEAIGGPRNWDYRYCWPRDSTFALYGLSLLGYHDEAARFLEFVARLCAAEPLPLQVCYRVDGSAELKEREIPGLAGYRNSRPVRVGNAAVTQLQLDTNGEVLDAAYTYAKFQGGLDRAQWQALSKLADYAAANWRRPDESIWEVRGGPRQFVYSKVMCWVALDRAVKIARRYGLPGPVARWSAARDAIRRLVLRRGYSRTERAFTQTLGGHTLDASVLLLPLIRFIKPRDPRMRATIGAVRARLAQNSLVARYENPGADGVGGREGAFSICTFWLIDCLTLLGDTRASKALFERMLSHAGPLGLFSEEVDPATGELLGNYPQAFTHTALLNSAHNLALYPHGVPAQPRR